MFSSDSQTKMGRIMQTIPHSNWKKVSLCIECDCVNPSYVRIKDINKIKIA